MSLMNLLEVRRLIDNAGLKLEPAGHLSNLNNKIRLEFSNRMTRCMGLAEYKNGNFSIKLSTPLFNRASDQQKEQVIIHEYCHILDKHLHGKMRGHQASWQQLMRLLGYQPNRCHNVNTEGFRNKVLLKCDCGTEYKVGTTVWNRIRYAQKAYVCVKCNRQVGLPNYVKKIPKTA